MFGWAKVYHSGWVVKNKADEKTNIKILLDIIVEKFPCAHLNIDQLTMLISETESNKSFGKMLIGRINSRRISVDRVQSGDQNVNFFESLKIK